MLVFIILPIVLFVIVLAINNKNTSATLCVVIPTVLYGILGFIKGDMSTGTGLIISAVLQVVFLLIFDEVNSPKTKYKPVSSYSSERDEQYERERREQERQIRERQLIVDAKKKVEMTAMSIAINHEVNNNRKPNDVSFENLGYDIKSSSNYETRYIEVKGKSESGDIEITQNEWNKAKELDNNYYLYVVYNCLNNPNLVIVRNPASKLRVNQDYYSGKYKVTKYEIINCSN